MGVRDLLEKPLVIYARQNVVMSDLTGCRSGCNTCVRGLGVNGVTSLGQIYQSVLSDWIVTLQNPPLRTAYLSLFIVISYYWRTTHDRIHGEVTNVCSESRSAILCDGNVAMLLVVSRYRSMCRDTGSGLEEYS